MLDKNRLVLQAIWLVALLYIALPPVIKTWHWRHEHFQMFDLVQELQVNHTDFYTSLGVESTATAAEISKAHRKLVLKLHPDTSTDINTKEEFDQINRIALYLKSSTLRPIYDTIYNNNGHLPCFKGVFYYYSRHRFTCMILSALIAVSLMEYLKVWDRYLTEKVAFDQFIYNAKLMATKLSDKHASASIHKSYIDLGDRTIQCEITADKEIFIYKQGQRVPLSTANMVPVPSILDISLFRLPKQLLFSNKQKAD